jgi:hypothetical protein
VTFAAKGVDLLEPLKPILPADDHTTTSPNVFVIDAIMLLKVM